MFPHAHSFPELLSWWGSDPDHPEDTTAMYMIMDDEEIRLDESWLAYVPAGMMHMPKRMQGGNITSKPVCHWTSGPGNYTRDKDGEEVKEEQDEAQKSYETVPGKKDNLKYFVFVGQQENVKKPAYIRELDPRYARHLAHIDETIIPDAELGCDTMYLLPGDNSKAGLPMMDAHIVPHGTSITFTAMNYDDRSPVVGTDDPHISMRQSFLSGGPGESPGTG